MSEVIRYKGKHSIIESEKVPDALIVSEAIIKNDGKTIVFDYVYEGKNLGVELKSEDGISFEGTYEAEDFDLGRQECSFILYKNDKGCFLYGDYRNAKHGTGMWLIKLERCENESIKQ